jgi:hypothetical protein
MLDLFSKSNHSIIQQEKISTFNFQESINEDNKQNITLNSTNEIYFYNTNANIFLNNKIKKDNNKKQKPKHTKYSFDNLKRECKHLVIENVMKFINNKIYDAYGGYIDNGLLKKKLFKLNQEQKTNADVEFNKIFINKTLKDILSQNITKQITLYDQDHNKKVIDKIISEKRDIFEKIFNLTFIQCLDHFIENKKIEELNGLTLYSELKEEIINKYENDGESYYENLKLFLKQFQNKINRAKSRKKRKNKL